ncbi:MAG: sigma-54 dependent transcriptional regulator [Polyangia bacterium]
MGTEALGNKVLWVDDDDTSEEILVTAMKRRGFLLTWKTSGAAALAALEEDDFDVMVADLHMDGMDGLELCERATARRPDMPVVMMTSFGNLESAVAAMRVGAYDFVAKPLDLEFVRLTLVRAIQHRSLRIEVQRLREVVAPLHDHSTLHGASLEIAKIKDVIDRVSGSDAIVLISGESGTGKELVAHALHKNSRRAKGPFVAINCAAMPEALLESELFGHVKGAFTDAHGARRGLFLKANGGTLFLDEIGEMPLGMQSKLLRALQERKVRAVGSDTEEAYDARIITASNRDLEDEVHAKRFREDLFYRINVVRIVLPTLRARGNDVLLLAQMFMKRYAAQAAKAVTSISTPVAEKLLAYPWPGNVRELQNCIERAVAFARFDALGVDDLPDHIRDYRSSSHDVPGVGPAEMLSMEEVERRYTLRVLDQHGGSKTAAASVLGFDRRTLHRKLLRWGLAHDDDSSSGPLN